MAYYVYMLSCLTSARKRTYVGYTQNIRLRLLNHNSNKGAKFTRGNKWKLIYKKKFNTQSLAMSYEYELKHDKKKRLEIFNKSL